MNREVNPGNALVLAPHPDDESFGCGGMIRRMTMSKARVDVAFLTRGEQGNEEGLATHCRQLELAQRRSTEALNACEILGVSNVLFLDGHDGQLSQQPHLRTAVLRLLQERSYRTVFCPWPGESHPDHAMTYHFLKAALAEYSSEVEVWLYEVWSPLTPNMVVPIDSAIEAKCAAMRAHASQLELADYVTAFRALAQYRSLRFPSSRHAEAFFVCQGSELREGAILPDQLPRNILDEIGTR